MGMMINKDIYQLIADKCTGKPNETGGILGGSVNIITEFEFDEGTALSSAWHYYPDVEKLNSCIKDWQNKNIHFHGIVHSHFKETRRLSSGDIQYINEIMQVMPEHVTSLYFPIVLPQKEIVFFRATRIEGKVNIVADDIKIIEEGE